MVFFYIFVGDFVGFYEEKTIFFFCRVVMIYMIPKKGGRGRVGPQTKDYSTRTSRLEGFSSNLSP